MMRSLLLLACLAACDAPAAISQHSLDGADAGPPAAQLSVTRTGPLIWEVSTETPQGELVWTLDGQHNLSPASPLWMGGDGVKLRFLDLDGVPLFSCSNCDVIESVALPGSDRLAWTGPGRGHGGDPAWPFVLCDGRVLDLAINATGACDRVEVRQTVVSYAPGETAQDPPRPVLQRETLFAVEGTALVFDAVVTAIAEHDMVVVYHGRPEAVTPCQGGVIDGYATQLGDSWDFGVCGPTEENAYGYAPAQEWMELTSSMMPIRVRITSLDRGDGIAAQRWITIDDTAAGHSDKAKIYGREFYARVSVPRIDPLAPAWPSRRHYAHRLDVLFDEEALP